MLKTYDDGGENKVFSLFQLDNEESSQSIHTIQQCDIFKYTDTIFN